MTTNDIVCYLCRSGKNESLLLLCDSCETGYHTYCLNMPSVPDTDWYCVECRLKNITVTENNKVYVYQRVSSAKQDNPKYGHVGLETQNYSILDHCKQNNYTIINTHIDVGSGRHFTNLKEMHNMVNNIVPGTNIIVYSASRIGRDANAIKKMINILHSKNCKFYSVMDKIYSDDNNFMKLVEQSQKESENLSRLMKASISRRKQMGGHIGKAPFGFTTYRDNRGIRKLSVHPVETQTLKLIQSSTTPPSQLAITLNKKKQFHRGKPWTASAVRTQRAKARKTSN